MKKFDKYIVKTYMKYLLIVQGFVLAVSTFMSALSHLDSYKEYGITLEKLAMLELITVPMSINSSLPIVVVVANIITILILMRSNELLAYVSLGGRIQRMLLPFILMSVITAFIMLHFDMAVYSNIRNSQQKYITEDIKKQRYRRSDSLVQMWLFDENRNLVYIGLLNPIENAATDLKYYDLNEHFEIDKITVVKSARYINNGLWEFKGVVVTDLTQSPPSTIAVNSYEEESKLLTDMSSISGRSPRHLSSRELAKAITTMKRRGQNTIKYEMILGSKTGSALSVIVLTLLVIPIGINFSRNYSAIKSASLSFALGMAFWAFTAFFNSLGSSGAVSPFIANYTPHIVFLIIGIIILRRRESAR